MSRHLDLNPPKGLAPLGGDHLGLRSEDQYRLYHGLKNNPETRGVAPSLQRMHAILLLTVFAQAKFLTTVDHSSYVSEITRPRYLKEVTTSRGCPQALKALTVTYLSSSAANISLFRSDPQVHCTVRLCVPFMELNGTSMSHRGHRGWGRSTSSRITTMSLTCRCQKCTLIAVRVNARPLHPSTGLGLGPALIKNAILQVLVSLPPPSAMSPSNPNLPLATPFGFWRCITSDPLVSSFPNSGNSNLSRCCSLKPLPSPVILRVQALSSCTLVARKVQNTTPRSCECLSAVPPNPTALSANGTETGDIPSLWKRPLHFRHLKNSAFTVSCWCPSSAHCFLSSRYRIFLPVVCDLLPLSPLLSPPYRYANRRSSQW